jgi:hypothetical protein
MADEQVVVVEIREEEDDNDDGMGTVYGSWLDMGNGV